MGMYFKSSTVCLFLVAVLLVRSCKSDAERSNNQTENRSVTDQPFIVYLDLSWEGLMSVPAISPGQQVHTLDLSHNNLHSLYNGNFYPYPNITKLILSSDNITSIEIKTFSNLQSLTEVDLSYNSLTFIHPSLFILNTNLRALSLQGNPLKTFEPGTPFLIATSLQSLDLSHCHLLQFSTESLSGLPKLEILDLRHNNLQQLSVNNISALSSLKLAGNPWQCDCHFHDLLIRVSTNQVMDIDIRTDNTVQCWLGDKMRNLITKKDWDSICKEATGHRTVPQLPVTSSQIVYAALDKKSDTAFPANNKDDNKKKYVFDDDDDDEDSEELHADVSLSAGELPNLFHQDFKNDDKKKYVFDDDNDSEELDADISLSTGEFPNLFNQNYTDLNLTVSTEAGDNHKKLSRKYEVTNSSTYSQRLYDNFIPELVEIDSYGEYSGEFEDSDESDGEYSGEFEDSDEFDGDIISIEIPSLDQEDNDLIVSMKIEDNFTAIETRNDRIDSFTVSISADDNFDLGFFEYDFYGAFLYFEELHNDVSVTEIPAVDSEDYKTTVGANYTLENSDLQELLSKTKLPISTTNFSSQDNDVIMNGIASDKSSLKISDTVLTDDIKNVTLNYRLDNDYDCILCDGYAIPATETQNLKHSNEYEFADPIVLLEKLNSKEVVGNAEDNDSSFQFQSIYVNFNSEDIGVQVQFEFDNSDSMEVTKNELLSDTVRFPDTVNEDNSDIDSLILSVLKGRNSAADVQEHETLMNQNDKPPNERYLQIYTVTRFLILVGMVLVVVFLLLVMLYCITSVHHTTAFPMQVNEYKILKNSMSENELVQNV